MNAYELRPGLWRWELPHPEWTPEDAEGGAGWDQIVASYSVEAGDAFLLLDPLAPPTGSDEAARFWRALDRDVERLGPPAVLLTIFWHARSAGEILGRYPAASVWVHEPATGLVGERTRFTDTFRLGDELPGGAVAYDAERGYEVLYWFPSHRAIAAGDVLLGAADGARVCPPSWTRDKSPEELKRELAPLLHLPVELLLLTHGDAVVDDARGALERALATA